MIPLAAGLSDDSLSNSEILKYMMLGYQLGYQNCFSGDLAMDSSLELGMDDSMLI